MFLYRAPERLFSGATYALPLTSAGMALMTGALCLLLLDRTEAQQRDAIGGPPGTGRISGQVSIADGAQRLPLRRATVTLIATTTKGSEASVATDGQGGFVIDRLPPGTYRVSVNKPGFVTVSAARDHVLSAAGTLNVAIEVQRAGAVEGRLITDRGVPVDRLQVAAELVTPALTVHAPATYRATTDDLGRFRIHTLPPGRYRVSSMPPGASDRLYFPGTEVISAAGLIEVGAGETVDRLDFTLPSGQLSTISPETSAAIEREFLAPDSPGFDSRITGRVTRSDVNLPVAGATVTLSSSSGVSLRTVLTDGDGQFAFPRLSPGKYSVTAGAPGFISVTPSTGVSAAGTPVIVASGSRVRVDPSLLPASAIEVRVLDEYGDPSPGVVVRISRGNTATAPGTLPMPDVRQSSERTDDRGMFRASRLLPGEYFISALPAPFASSTPAPFAPTYFPGVGSPDSATPILVGSGVDTQVSFVLLTSKTVTVAGVVQNHVGEPMANASVALQPPRSAVTGLSTPLQATTVAGKDGTFVFRNIPEGLYHLAGFGSNAFGSIEFQAAAAESEARSIVLTLKPLATARGRIDLDGVPLPAATEFVGLSYVSAGPPLGPPMLEFGHALAVARDGTFLIRNISARGLIRQTSRNTQWVLSRVMLHGRDITDVPYDFQDGDTDGLQVVVTARLGAVLGTVHDTSGPVPGATVLIFGAENVSPHYVSRTTLFTRTTDQGTFEITRVLPGRYHVALSAPGQSLTAASLDELRRTAALVIVSEGSQTKIALTRVR